MQSVSIQLHLAENVKQFVQAISRFDGELDLKSGRHIVDAKSLLGIFSLDLSKPLTLDIHSDDCAQLLLDIAPFLIEA